MPEDLAPKYELLRSLEKRNPPEPEQESAEERRRRKHRESQRRYRERHPQRHPRKRTEKDRQYIAAWKKANPEKMRQYRRKWAEENPDYAPRWNEEHGNRWAESFKRWSKANPEKVREKERRKRAKAGPEKMREKWRRQRLRRQSIKAMMESPDKIYSLILSALPSGLPRHVRDDVVGSLCLAIMERKVLVKNIKAEVGKFLKAYNREYDTFKTLSLDELIPGTKTTRLDALAAE